KMADRRRVPAAAGRRKYLSDHAPAGRARAAIRDPDGNVLVFATKPQLCLRGERVDNVRPDSPVNRHKRIAQASMVNSNTTDLLALALNATLSVSEYAAPRAPRGCL